MAVCTGIIESIVIIDADTQKETDITECCSQIEIMQDVEQDFARWAFYGNLTTTLTGIFDLDCNELAKLIHIKPEDVKVNLAQN